MNLSFFQSIYDHPFLNRNELKEIIEAHVKINFSKGSMFLESGKMAHEYFLIESVLLRPFVCDFNGNEITTDFYSSNEIAIEVSSLFKRVPTKENIIALTDGIGWKIEFDKFQNLYHNIESFREWGRAWISVQFFDKEQSKIEILTSSATERYKQLMIDKPEIIRYAPIKHIASYLGITDTSLSRIRKEILNH